MSVYAEYNVAKLSGDEDMIREAEINMRWEAARDAMWDREDYYGDYDREDEE